jgi:hypothetical protein
LSEYVQAHGGAKGAAQQMLAASQAGAGLAGFLVGVQHDGLAQTLVNAGLGELVGQPAHKVLRGLTDYLVGPGSLLEDDAVRSALLDYQEELFSMSDYQELEAALTRLVQEDGIGTLLKRFFGYCIYRRLCMHLTEHFMKAARGARATKRLLKDIKEFIFSKLDVRTHRRNLMQINWRGSEGNKLAQEILTSVLRVFKEA